MNPLTSTQIRDLAEARYVNPAIMAGKRKFSIRVRDLLNNIKAEGYPGGHTPRICSALRTAKFLRANGLEIENIEGPPSKKSPMVVFHYRVVDEAKKTDTVHPAQQQTEIFDDNEDSDAWALRVTEGIRGLLKKEIAEFGGTEGFMRWVRSSDEDSE